MPCHTCLTSPFNTMSRISYVGLKDPVPQHTCAHSTSSSSTLKTPSETEEARIPPFARSRLFRRAVHQLTPITPNSSISPPTYRGAALRSVTYSTGGSKMKSKTNSRKPAPGNARRTGGSRDRNRQSPLRAPARKTEAWWNVYVRKHSTTSPPSFEPASWILRATSSQLSPSSQLNPRQPSFRQHWTHANGDRHYHPSKLSFTPRATATTRQQPLPLLRKRWTLRHQVPPQITGPIPQGLTTLYQGLCSFVYHRQPHISGEFFV